VAQENKGVVKPCCRAQHGRARGTVPAQRRLHESDASATWPLDTAAALCSSFLRTCTEAVVLAADRSFLPILSPASASASAHGAIHGTWAWRKLHGRCGLVCLLPPQLWTLCWLQACAGLLTTPGSRVAANTLSSSRIFAWAGSAEGSSSGRRRQRQRRRQCTENAWRSLEQWIELRSPRRLLSRGDADLGGGAGAERSARSKGRGRLHLTTCSILSESLAMPVHRVHCLERGRPCMGWWTASPMPSATDCTAVEHIVCRRHIPQTDSGNEPAVRPSQSRAA